MLFLCFPHLPELTQLKQHTIEKTKKKSLDSANLQTEQITRALFLLLHLLLDSSTRYIPLSANRSAKRRTTEAQQSSLLGLCLLTVAAIVTLAEKEKHL